MAGYIPEDDLSQFTLLDLTYLCFTRSTNDNTGRQYDQVRISLLYNYGVMMYQSAQATFECVDGSWKLASVSLVTANKHIYDDMTIEGCKDCTDDSTFASPTYCRCE